MTPDVLKRLCGWCVVSVVIVQGPALSQTPLFPVVSETPDWRLEDTIILARLGFSVSAAGDVNGDGYGDLIVGRPAYPEGAARSRVYVYTGGLSGLGHPSHFYVQGEPGELVGFSVAGAGDVNRDGYDDVIWGAPLYDHDGVNKGLVRVHHGSDKGIRPSPSRELPGRQNQGQFGVAVAGAGDVNGDGFADVIVGAAFENWTLRDEGRVYFYPGGPSGLVKNVFVGIQIDVEGARFGNALGSAGDVNGDGYPDIIVGAPYYSNGEESEGAAFVYLGSPDGPVKPAAWSFEPDVAGAQFGASVSTAGDVNGDGYADIVVGARGYPGEFELPDGRAYLFLGSPGGPSPAPDRTLSYGRDNGFGYTVGGAGDLNDDGYSDLLVGSSEPSTDQAKEAAYIYLGSPDGIGADPQQIVTQTTRNDVWSQSATTVASAGDVNGDGLGDIVVGNHSLLNKGVVSVYHALSDRSTIPDTPSHSVSGAQVDAGFARKVLPAGDVDGDGWTDVLVGAHLNDGDYEDEGAVYLYRVTADGFDSEPVWSAHGHGAGEWFGHDLANVGDVNGDGIDDVVVGAPYFSSTTRNAGAVFLYMGTPEGFSDSHDWMATGNAPDSRFGYSVGRADDVNRDGYADVVVGAFLDGDETGGRPLGSVTVYYGSPYGLSQDRVWTVEGDQRNAWFGFAVAGAGDIDRDGIADIIVGAPLFDGQETDQGAVFLFEGSPSGLRDVSVRRTIPRAGAQLGWSVSSAGDVNGDLYGDVIASANGKGAVMLDGRGSVFVFTGNPTDVSDQPVWEARGNPLIDAFGSVVGTPGDINGDGRSEIVIGDPGYDRGAENDVGRVLVYAGSDSGPDETPLWNFEGTRAGELVGQWVGGLGDVNRDGDPDLIVGAAVNNAGERTGVMHFFVFGRQGARLSARQERVSDGQPIGVQGYAESPNWLQLVLEANPAPDATSVRLEYETAIHGEPLDGSNLRSGPWRLLTPDERSEGIASLSSAVVVKPSPGGAHWRARLRTNSPTQPYSQWAGPRYNPSSVPHVRMGYAPAIQPPPPPPPEPVPRYALEMRSVYPNPFKRPARIEFTLPRPGFVEVGVYDVTGALVRSLLTQRRGDGPYTVEWDGTNGQGREVAAGVYVARLRFERRMLSRKMILLR